MNARLLAIVLLSPFLLLQTHAADDLAARSDLFGEWIYPGSSRVQEGKTAGDPPTAETGQYTTEDSVQEVLYFYAKKAGLDATAQPLHLDVPDDAGMVSIGAHDDTPSVVLLRNVGKNTASVLLLYWTPADRQKIAISLTRGEHDLRTHIQLILHRRR